MINCPKCNSENVETASKGIAGLGIIVIATFLAFFLWFLAVPLLLFPVALVSGFLYMRFGKPFHACKECKHIFTDKKNKESLN